MWDKLKQIALPAVLIFGVLFIIIILVPEDKEDSGSNQENVIVQQEEEEAGKGKEAQEEEKAGKRKEGQKETKDGQKNKAGDDTKKVTIPEAEISGEQMKFETVSLDGETVTQEIFVDYDLTIVHVWGTFCGPCIAEMGDYAALYKELPDNVNLVGILCDVYDGSNSNVRDAKDILGDAGAEFLNLRTSEELYNVTGSLQYVPSSFFVDGKGHIVGEMMDGVGFDETKKRLDGYLE